MGGIYGMGILAQKAVLKKKDTNINSMPSFQRIYNLGVQGEKKIHSQDKYQRFLEVI